MDNAGSGKIGRVDFFIKGDSISIYEIKKSGNIYEPSADAQKGKDQIDQYTNSHFEDDNRELNRGNRLFHGQFIYYDFKTNT